MSAINSPCPVYTSGGTPVAYTGAGTIASPYVNTLSNGTTYYVDLGSEFLSTGYVQWVYDSSIVITSITYASTSLPRTALATWGAAAGGWVTEAALPVLTVAGGAAGTQRTPISGAGSDRLRAVVVVGGTGGSIVPTQNWKAA